MDYSYCHSRCTFITVKFKELHAQLIDENTERMFLNLLIDTAYMLHTGTKYPATFGYVHRLYSHDISNDEVVNILNSLYKELELV